MSGIACQEDPACAEVCGDALVMLPMRNIEQFELEWLANSPVQYGLNVGMLGLGGWVQKIILVAPQVLAIDGHEHAKCVGQHYIKQVARANRMALGKLGRPEQKTDIGAHGTAADQTDS